MTRMQRRVMSRPPLSAADVEDRKLVLVQSQEFEASPAAQLAATADRLGIREWSQSCSRCGSVLVFHGTIDTWIDRAITFDDTHVCGGVA